MHSQSNVWYVSVISIFSNTRQYTYWWRTPYYFLHNVFSIVFSMTDSRWQNVKYKTKCKELGSVVSKYNMTNHFLDPFYTRICILCECQAKNTSYGVNEMFLSCTSHSSFTIDVMKCIPIPIKYVQFSLCLFIQFVHFEIWTLNIDLWNVPQTLNWT